MNLQSYKVLNSPATMNLQSGEVGIKRPKNSSDEDNEQQREDIIGKLPDALLIQILSLLPEADANRTRILSNRWKHLWAFLPNLHFVMPFRGSNEEISRFHDSIDQTLALRRDVPIQKFFLHCFYYNCNYDRVYDALCSAVQCKVQEFELEFPYDRRRVRFCWDLFKTCNSLVKLTLKGEFVLDVPKAELLFPCLKRINLLCIVYLGDQTVVNLLSGCPVLEELFVERDCFSRFDKVLTFNISSSSLKRLTISFSRCMAYKGDYKVVINAPKLEYIYIRDAMSSEYSFTEPLSFIGAHIGETLTIAQLITHVSLTKILTLTFSATMALCHMHGFNMPMFPNLVKLVIGIDCICGWNLLPVLLNNMPNLEHITFTDWLRAKHLLNVSWNPTADPPACLCSKLKEITMRHRKAVTQEEFTFIKYLLKHSNNQVTLTIYARNIDPEMREQLLNFSRDSDLCRLEFV